MGDNTLMSKDLDMTSSRNLKTILVFNQFLKNPQMNWDGSSFTWITVLKYTTDIYNMCS